MNFATKILESFAWLVTSADFWVSFCSGVASLVLGIPIALWITRWTERRQHRREEEETQGRLIVALGVLDTTLARNKTQIERTLAQLDADENPVLLAVNTDLWQVLQYEIAPHLRDPELQADIAAHFAHVRFAVELHGRLVEHVLRP